MKIQMPDGRYIDGTPVEIVSFMRSIAFVDPSLSLSGYILYCVEQARTFQGVDLEVSGESEEEMAASFIEAIVDAGLAQRLG